MMSYKIELLYQWFTTHPINKRLDIVYDTHGVILYKHTPLGKSLLLTLRYLK